MAEEENYNCYSDDHHNHHHHHVNSSSNPNATTSFETSPLEIFNFESHNSVSHNSVLFSSSSSSKPITDSDFYHFDESSLQRCMFPSESNERPTQGLSLSLSSANPSTIGLQSFEHNYQHHNHQGYFGKSMSMDHDQHHHHMMIQESYNHQHEYNIRSSRYLVPAQELLNEFCNLGSKQNDHSSKAKGAASTSNQWQDHDNLNNASSSKTKSLSSIEFMELQKKKTKLLQMLEEV